jgi:hypothetical protein
MDAEHDHTSPLRTGMRRLIPPWEYHHLRAFAGARIAGGIVSAVCGVLTLAYGGADGKTYGWAALFLGAAALACAACYWELIIARSASPRT